MEQHTQSPKFQRQRKFLMVLPVLVLPFITFMFWVLGGGKAEDVSQQEQTGFNMNLPGAYLKDERSLNKLSYYEKAGADSAKLEKLIKNDPYYKLEGLVDADGQIVSDSGKTLSEDKNSGASRINRSPHSGLTYHDPNEAKIYEKLEELNNSLNPPLAIQEPIENDHLPYSLQSNAGLSGDAIGRLEQMMQAMDQPEEEDPELQQLNGMLEKILDIQHPDRVQEKLRQLSERRKGQVFPVYLETSKDPVSLMDQGSITDRDHHYDTHFATQTNGFFSLDNLTPSSQAGNAIKAVVHETQTLTSGATVKLRLINDIYINGVLIPNDHFLFGIASLNGERLHIEINSIRYKNSLFPVALSVYDMDGLNGIYIPGTITREVARQSTDRAVQSFGLTALDPSLGAQAASAGIEAAQNLLSKKVKLVKVTVKAGYQVLLLDKKQNYSIN